ELNNAEDIDKVIEAYYRNNYFRAKHILVEDEALAKELLEKARNGADFDALMKEYSTDPGTAYYPDGYVFTYNEMVPVFEECVRNTDIGGFGLCRSDYGWHVILRLELPEDYSDVQYDIELALLNSHIRERISEDALKYGVTSEINWELINAVG
ncbi:MAG: peptidylprolyl isomerase, partial [Candidatus Ornithomonoglobus sp.]